MDSPTRETWEIPSMLRPATKSRAQLESENEQLLRHVRALQAKCRSLSSHNAELTYLYLRSSCQLLPDSHAALPSAGELRDVSTRGNSSFAPLGLGTEATTMTGRLDEESLFAPVMHSRSSNAFDNCQASPYARESAATVVQDGLVQHVPSAASKPEHGLFDYTQKGTRLLDCGFSQDFNHHNWPSHGWEPQTTPGIYSIPEMDLMNNYSEANAACSPATQDSTTDLPSWISQDTVWALQPDGIADCVQATMPLVPTEYLNPSVENCARADDNQTRHPPPLLRHIRAVPELQNGFNASPPRGKLDQYISLLQQVLGRVGQNSCLTPKRRAKVCAEGVLWAVREAWPGAEHFWKTTASFKGFVQSEMWRNFPGQAVYDKMHPAYRPTARQLVTPHSPLIDWVPWPEIREKLIEQQDCLDVELACKTAIQNLVAHRTSLVPYLPRGRKRSAQEIESTDTPRTLSSERRKSSSASSSTTTTSFRIWDLCLLEEKAGFRPNGAGLVYTPKSAGVQALEKAYGLEYDNFHTQKLHPSFFQTFPTLFAGSVVSGYAVQELPVAGEHAGRDILGSPQGLLPGAGDRLQALIDRALKAPC